MLRSLYEGQAKRQNCMNNLGGWVLKETYYNKANLWNSPSKHPCVKALSPCPQERHYQRVHSKDWLASLLGFDFWAKNWGDAATKGAWKKCKPAPWEGQNQQRNYSLLPPRRLYPFKHGSPQCHQTPVKHQEHCSQYWGNDTCHPDTHCLRVRYHACKCFHHSWFSSAWGKDMVWNFKQVWQSIDFAKRQDKGKSKHLVHYWKVSSLYYWKERGDDGWEEKGRGGRRGNRRRRMTSRSGSISSGNITQGNNNKIPGL